MGFFFRIGNWRKRQEVHRERYAKRHLARRQVTISMDSPHQIDLNGSKDDIARWIWKTLVPKSGPASFVQAEVLRAIEKLRWEAQGNGNINWDNRFVMLVDFIEETLTSQSCFSSDSKSEIRRDIDRLRNFLPPSELKDDSQIPELPYVKDDLYDRLTDRLIEFCRDHPQLIPFTPDPRQYR